ncbi:MAG TPA: DUF169 domain-containing protein [Bacteroidales bacterium]|nr:DUF169 domain-containing protein [Bacteroidales bacterium]
MKPGFKQEFLSQWEKYFGSRELPVAFFYTKDRGDIPAARQDKPWSCLICELAQVRKGESLAWNEKNLKCGGSMRYLGYTQKMRKNFEYFLSCGIPGEMEGERYIRTPEMVKELMEHTVVPDRKGEWIVFKRWDKLESGDEPIAVIFFANPDTLSGLFTLANFDQVDGHGTVAPFGSGCSSIVHRAIEESKKENPAAVLGMFDPSARPCVPRDTLSYSVPMKKFEKMVGYMDESFLITDTWKEIRKHL